MPGEDRIFPQSGSHIRGFSRSPDFFGTGLISKNLARSGLAQVRYPEYGREIFTLDLGFDPVLRFFLFIFFINGRFLTSGLMKIQKFYVVSQVCSSE